MNEQKTLIINNQKTKTIKILNSNYDKIINGHVVTAMLLYLNLPYMQLVADDVVAKLNDIERKQLEENSL